MSLVQRTIPTLFNGVSRQPAILRAADQTEDELNSWASLSSGVGKRPGTTYIKKLFDSLVDGAHIHAINRDSSERYFVIVSAGSVRVFGFDGVERVVSAPGGFGYLTGSDYAAVTVADYTFIVNRSTVVKIKAAGADETAQSGYLRYVPKTYNDFVGVPGAYDTVLSGQALQYLPNPSTAGGLTGTVGSMEELPVPVVNGAIYKVSGSTGGSFLSYYVRGNGTVWDETVAPATQNALDETTMPHCLVREGDGTFTFAPFSWAPRRVGDAATNPFPTFVGRKLRDVALYQNRLTLLVDESVVMSGAGDFGNFFRSTVLDLVDSDPVDVAITTSNVAVLDFITLFNDGALLFADQTQFSLSNAEAGVTPASVAIRPVTRYSLNRAVRPVIVGTEVYFAGDSAGYSVLYEYTRQADNDTTSAAEITAHVPGLIPGGLTQLVAIPRGLLALTGTSKIYCYQLYWNGNEKAMSAWRPWDIGGVALAAAAIGSEVFLLVERAEGVCLEKIELADGYTLPTQDQPVHLDRQTQPALSYGGGGTTVIFPYPVPTGDRDNILLIGGTDGSRPYGSLDLSSASWTNDTTLVIPGTTYGTITAGFPFDFAIELSEQFQLTPQGVPVTTGRLLLRQLTLNYFETSSFTVEVWPYGRAPHPALDAKFPNKSVVFSGRILGSGSSVLGAPAIASGSYSFAIIGEAKRAVIRVSSSSHTGATFTSAEWEGFYQRRR